MPTPNKYEKIRQMMLALGYPAYRYRQFTHAVFQRHVGRFAQMEGLPRPLREALERELGPSVCRLAPLQESASPQVQKILFRLTDDERIETVALRYRRGWESFCLSSQCGCGFGCRFCATGALGPGRNLTADEITDQMLYFYLNGHSLDSVSFMGMGEALANPHLFEALALLTDPALFGLGQRRITVSTIGILPGIEKLAANYPQINLALSLHSPFDRQRSELMPVNETYPLDAVMRALDGYIQKTGRKVFIAYILLRGVNDSPAHAKALATLLGGRGPWAHLYHVDLIPYNPTESAALQFAPTGKAGVRQFQRSLESSGVRTTVRAQFGAGIDAACGQLHGR